jgi:hypothetical protein
MVFYYIKNLILIQSKFHNLHFYQLNLIQTLQDWHIKI